MTLEVKAEPSSPQAPPLNSRGQALSHEPGLVNELEHEPRESEAEAEPLPPARLESAPVSLWKHEPQAYPTPTPPPATVAPIPYEPVHANGTDHHDSGLALNSAATHPAANPVAPDLLPGLPKDADAVPASSPLPSAPGPILFSAPPAAGNPEPIPAPPPVTQAFSGWSTAPTPATSQIPFSPAPGAPPRNAKAWEDARAACDRLIAVLELARDLDQKQRSMVDDAVRIPIIPYLGAQLRMRIAPALGADWVETDPIHIVLFGGTNSGKSTVLNVLVGRCVAVMNPTARYSQHPEAYCEGHDGEPWLKQCPTRFSDYLRFDDTHPPRQSDGDLARHGYRPAFSIHHLTAPGQGNALGAIASASNTPIVFWDAPDFSTEQARAYLRAVIDSVALADVVVMAVTEENYADDRGLAYLRMLTNSGVAVILAANKMPLDAEDRLILLPDMKQKLTDNRRDSVMVVPAETFHVLPRVRGQNPESRLQILLESPEAQAFRDALRRTAAGGRKRKRQTLAHVLDFIDRRLDDALRPLQAEVDQAARWRMAVAKLTETHFLQRYRSEYLDGKGYGEFNRTLVRLMELLKMPHIGPVIALLGDIVRVPFRLATRAVNHLWTKVSGHKPKAAAKSPEGEVLDKLTLNWFAEIKALAQTFSSETGHPAWDGLIRAIDAPAFTETIEENLAGAYFLYRKDVEKEEIERARQIYQVLEQNPALLNSLRGGKALFDVMVIMLVIKSGGLNWSDAVVGPLVAGVMHLMMEGGLRGYLETQRASLKQWQLNRMRTVVQACLQNPAEELFHCDIDQNQIRQAREDFSQVKTMALWAVREDAQS